eukprot:scaffold13356_cov109-Cylindrotheca_fusiformis.AAC.1
MTPDEPFKSLSQTVFPADETSGQAARVIEVHKVLLWPEFCAPPVGLYWPVTTTFLEFCSSVRGNQLFSAFLDCCLKDSMVNDWFDAVNVDHEDFVVHMADASVLWDSLPDPVDPQGQGVENVELVEPFQYQFERFLWSIHCDRIQRSTHDKCGSLADKRAFYWYLKHGNDKYPQELPDARLPPTHKAFFAYLMVPESAWP